MVEKSNEIKWKRVKSVLKEEVDSFCYSAYIAPVTIAPGSSEKDVILSSTDKTDCSWFRVHYLRRVREIWSDITGSDVSVQIKFAQVLQFSTSTPKVFPVGDFSFRSHLNPQFTFENFFFPDSNKPLVYACKHVASTQHQEWFNPLYFFGNYGIGKTHLMHSIAHNFTHLHKKDVLYLPADRFVSSFVMSIQNKNVHVFRSKIRSYDMILIDDIQTIVGKEKSEQELIHTMLDFITSNKMIILSSDMPITSSPSCNSRLSSLLASGLCCRLESPDYQAFHSIVMNSVNVLKKTHYPVHVTADDCRFLMHYTQGNPRRLKGIINQAIAYNLSRGSKEGSFISSIKGLIESIPSTPVVQIDVNEIIRYVSEDFDVSPRDIRSGTRKRLVSRARYVAMYLCKSLTPHSVFEIGRFFDRHHASTLYALKKVEGDQNLKNMVLHIRRRLGH